MITRKKEKETIKKKKYFPSSDIESSPISNSHQQEKKFDHKKKNKEENFQMSGQMKMHNLLEVIEFRIHFDQDPDHGHPAQSVSILDEKPDHKITDMSEEELSMKYNYKLINPIQIIPDFWPKRMYDDIVETVPPKSSKKKVNQTSDNHLNSEEENSNESENENTEYYDNNQQIIPIIKLSKKESNLLLEKISAASDIKLKPKSKQKKKLKHNQKSYDKDGDFSNPEDDDDESEKNEISKFISFDITTHRRTRSQFKYKKSRKEFILSLPSLLYDTDESCDETDGELF